MPDPEPLTDDPICPTCGQPVTQEYPALRAWLRAWLLGKPDDDAERDPCPT